jgi:predicted membrane protein
MTGIEIVLWIVLWIIGIIGTLVVLYYVNNKVTLANAVCAILFWWIILPIFFIAGVAFVISWLFTTANDIVLVERGDWWLSKEERKILREEKKKEKKGKGLTLNNILRK